MATLNLTNVLEHGATWEVTGLGSPFNTTNYQKVVVCTDGSVVNGQNTVPSGILGTITAPASGSSTNTGTSTFGSGLNAGTNTNLYAYALVPSGGYYASGSAQAQTRPDLPTGVSTSVSGLNITVNFTPGQGASETQMDKSWVAGVFDQTTTGTSFSFTVPSNNTTYTFTLASLSYTNSRSSPFSSAYSFTSGGAPISTPSVSLSSTTTSITYSQSSVANAATYFCELWNGANTSMIASSSGPTPRSGTWSGLTSGTTYTVRSYATATSGFSNSAVGTQTITTGALPSTPSSAPLTNYRVEGGLNLSWGSSANATSYVLKLERVYDGFITEIDVGNTTTYTVTGLYYGVTYNQYVKGRNSNGDSAYTAYNIGTTAPQTPTISQGTTTSTSITINTGNVFNNYDTIEVYRYDAGGTYIDMQTVSANSSVTWNGLPANTTYKFDARTRFFVNSTTIYSVSYSSRLTVLTSARPTNWTWTTSVDGAGHKLVNQPFRMVASEWNSFTQKINLFRVYKSLGNYAFTNAATGNTIYYYILNEALSAINSIPTRTISLSQTSVGSGSACTAALFNNMMDSLNSTP